MQTATVPTAAVKAATKKALSIKRAHELQARAAALVAQTERDRLDAADRAQQRMQAERDRRFYAYIAAATRGIKNLVELAQNPAIQELVQARNAIKKPTHLYSATRLGCTAWQKFLDGQTDDFFTSWRDTVFKVSVLLTGDAVVLVALEETPADDDPAVRAQRWVHSIAFERTEDESIDWLVRLAFYDMEREFWYLDLVDNEDVDKLGATDWLLAEIARTNPLLATHRKQQRLEWRPNIVLLRFLIDASDPKKLGRRLTRALERLT